MWNRVVGVLYMDPIIRSGMGEYEAPILNNQHS